jgi:hypothetical protein
MINILLQSILSKVKPFCPENRHKITNKKSAAINAVTITEGANFLVIIVVKC